MDIFYQFAIINRRQYLTCLSFEFCKKKRRNINWVHRATFQLQYMNFGRGENSWLRHGIRVQVDDASMLSIIFSPTKVSMWNKYLESGSLAMSCSSCWSVFFPTPTAISVIPARWARRACSLVRFLEEDTPSVTTMASFGTPCLWPKKI